MHHVVGLKMLTLGPLHKPVFRGRLGLIFNVGTMKVSGQKKDFLSYENYFQATSMIETQLAYYHRRQCS